ncbi:MAG TPA: PEP-CTERM sorting domain-containing protein [Planctomycetota bacterium]|nr:PEP-CTERM sorting domain-containing protein [Planctomycetota bacterium]
MVRDGSYRFLLLSHTYALTSTPSVVVGDTAGLSPSLTLWLGTLAGVEGRVATVAGGSGTVTVGAPGQPATWVNSAGLYVGDAGTGVLDVLNGSLAASATGYLGYADTSTGTATVDGAGSTWASSSDLYVGSAGTGTLTVQNGGRVENSTGYLGYDFASTGTAAVDGVGSTWANSSLLHVGFWGGGTLTVQNGGRVENSTCYLGGNFFGDGTATVDGAGSTWANSSFLYVGGAGTGTLTVQNGGRVENTDGYLGYQPFSTGTATVDGGGSLWDNAGSLYVGDWWDGGAGTLTASNGGEVRVAGTLKVSGTVNLNTGGLAAADVAERDPGSGSTFNTQAGSTLRVNALSGFGNAPSFAGSLHLGHAAGLSGSGAYSRGSGQSLSVGQELVLGYDAPGTLNVLTGGSVSNTDGCLGYEAAGVGTATVDGVGSTWANSSSLFVGRSGTGTLTVQNGGRVENAVGHLAFYGGSTGTATVDGVGSTWANSSFLYVGSGGTGTLTVQNGGRVESSAGYLGVGGVGTATVDGVGSTWANSSDLNVGGDGMGTLTVQNGGRVENADGYLAPYGGSTGTATVDGAGGNSVWANAGELHVGEAGIGALSILNGGKVESAAGTLGSAATGIGTATVDGAGGSSLWASTGELCVGADGEGTLNILHGGEVRSAAGGIGVSPSLSFSTSIGTVTVDGAGGNSLWANSGSLSVGLWGTGTLNVLNSGRVESTDAYLGLSVGTGTALVDGDGSTWACSDSLGVGIEGTGTLNILNGGRVESSGGTLGAIAGTGTALVDGNGSTWVCSGTLTLGSGTSGQGVLTIRDGGHVQSYGAVLGSWIASRGAATVEGAGSTWDMGAGELSVGLARAQPSRLDILDGGTVLSGGAVLGRLDCDGAIALRGTSSSWTSSGSVYLSGYSSGQGTGWGTLSLGDGTEVHVWNTLKVWNQGSVDANAACLLTVDTVDVVPGGAFATGAGTTLRVNGLAYPWTSLSLGSLQIGHTGGVSGAGDVTMGAGQSMTLADSLVIGYNAPGIFRWMGGPLSAGTVALSAQGTLVMGFDFDLSAVGSGSLWGGTTTGLDLGTLQVTNGATGTLPGGSVAVGTLGVDAAPTPATFRWMGGTLKANTLAMGAGTNLEIGFNCDLGDLADGHLFGGTLTGMSGVNLTLTNGAGAAFTHSALPAATLTLDPGASLSLMGGSVSIAGQTVVSPGSSLTVGPSGSFATGSLGNAGTLVVLAPTVDFGAGGLTNTGDAIFMGTTVDGTVYTPTGSTVTVLNTVTFNDAVSGAGTFWGPGTTVFNGGYGPGDSPAITTFQGSVVLGATNQLIMELAGLAAGTGYDQVNILGNVTLGGELELLVDRAFRDLIQPTDMFFLMSAGGVSGDFANVLPGGLLVSEDGLSRFNVYYGLDSPYGADVVVLSNFAAVPEPATLTLLALGGLTLLRRRRCSR